MSSLDSGLWHCFRGRPGFASLKTAVWVLLAPAVAITQNSREFLVPDLDSNVLLMAAVVEVQAQVTFADPIGIGAVNDLQIATFDQALADLVRVTVPPGGSAGGARKATVQRGTKTAASLTIAAPPGMPITIHVDEIVTGDGYSLADFRCNYNARGDTACDGPGYAETSVASSTLLVGATLTGIENLMAGATDGSFEVTITYQ